MDCSKHCAARYSNVAPDPRLLSVFSDGGVVTSRGDGVLSGPIDCGAICQSVFEGNTIVTLTATPASGFGFSGWSADCTGTSPETTVTMDAPKACRANFRPFDLAVAVTGEGRVTSDPIGIDCGGRCSYAPGVGTATLIASPETGWQFDGWGGDCSGTWPQASVTMDADRSCTAAFSRLPGQFLLRMVIEGQGSVNEPAAGARTTRMAQPLSSRPPRTPVSTSRAGPAATASRGIDAPS
jgi:uncharacterized repeat protein (TIGR02543 family)